MDKKNVIILTLAILLTAVVVGGGVYLWQQKSQDDESSQVSTSQQKPAEKDKSTEATTPDKIESKQPPVVEQKSEKQLITEAMATKHNKNVSDVDLTVNKSDGTYASGLVKFTGEVAGAWWLAVKEDGMWKIVADGNGTVMCNDISSYNFPTSMVPECWDNTSQTLITR